MTSKPPRAKRRGPAPLLPLYIDEATGEERIEQAFLDRVIELGKAGKTKAVIARECGVAKSTVDHWRNAHPDFRHAYDVALTAAQAWWEEQGQVYLVTETGHTFNQQVWYRFLAAHFRDDWMERREVTSRDGDREELSRKTDEELDLEIQKIEAQRAAREAAQAAAAAARAKARAKAGDA